MAYLLHHLLTESAARFPDKEALRFEGQGMTYASLDSSTNQVARVLRRLGMAPGDRIGIYLHKSAASVVGVFGIMKAGGTYVPLDPNAPPKRLAHIIRNSGVKILLTSGQKLRGVAEIVKEGSPLKALVMMDDQPSSRSSPDGLPRLIPWSQVCTEDRRPVTSEGVIENDLAYILYTSGSTGEPKGVMVSHRTLFTFINWCSKEFNMDSNDRVTSHAPLQFDLSTFDIYVTIKAGGTVIIVPENLSVFPERLADLLESEAVTVTYLVPSILSMMVNYGKLSGRKFSALRRILFAGEVFPIKYLRALVAAIPHVTYYNLFGPTETNVCAFYKVQQKDISAECTDPVPIGIACENMQVFAVDEKGDLVDTPGTAGELWVRGSGVAQGYWGDGQKTAMNFVRNPFQNCRDEIAYRTGDIVKLDNDGVNWRYVGRRDHMIKSRGYRIELGEIESVLYTHKRVKEVAVVAIPDELVGNRIKAYVVLLEGNGLTAKDLETHCSSSLPRYMVPEWIELCSDLPKTSTGKINRPLLAQT